MKWGRMSRYVIDAWAWIEYFNGSDFGRKVSHYLENEHNELFTLSVTLAEVTSFFVRKQKDPNDAFAAITTLSKVESVDADLAKFTGELHASLKKSMGDFGLADAFILAFAKKNNVKIISGDPHLKKQKETISIE